ncbi:hypothetical protein E2P81_ATG01361 [Venturia nashicola]|uniref:Uncharacterized protein n=1 Tax=Venturia nashicola TaxID=86259 RepID=A0A4Z1PV71_9PEZI|nr:hypothetical protein E6O75_ATG01392 [Venturia nashicola]TLD38818.1 hypothetical protein E2P81_ATG01361 [Venturia nashicola]
MQAVGPNASVCKSRCLAQLPSKRRARRRWSPSEVSDMELSRKELVRKEVDLTLSVRPWAPLSSVASIPALAVLGPALHLYLRCQPDSYTIVVPTISCITRIILVKSCCIIPSVDESLIYNLHIDFQMGGGGRFIYLVVWGIATTTDKCGQGRQDDD